MLREEEEEWWVSTGQNICLSSSILMCTKQGGAVAKWVTALDWRLGGPGCGNFASELW